VLASYPRSVAKARLIVRCPGLQLPGDRCRAALNLGHFGSVERALYCPSTSQQVTIATVVAGPAEFAIAFESAN
jgi:hypothetical protein